MKNNIWKNTGFTSVFKPQSNNLCAMKFQMAGAAGFEPTHGGSKTRCLTAWLRPNVIYSITAFKVKYA